MERINRPFSWVNQAGRLALACAMLGALAACGGGGSSGTPVLGGGGTNPDGTTPSAKMTVALSSTTVTAAAPATVTATLNTAAGAAIAGQVVTFKTTGGLGSFSANTALTDGNGVATVILKPSTPSATGADTVTATATVDTREITASTGFQLSATDVTVSSFTSDVTNLSAYGQATLTVVLGGTSASSPVNVTLTSSCATNGKGTLTPAALTTSTGRAVFTFRDNGCGAIQRNDNLQVSVTGTSATASLTLPVASPEVSSISFVESAPGIIYLRSSGYVENSNVKFRIKDANGNGVPEQFVVLEASTLAGGLTMDGGQVPVTKKTDANGDVIVRINSGTVPTPVRVKATLQGSNISTVSSDLAVAVGLPSQLNFSLSQGTHNIEGYDRDGTVNTYSIIAADRLGNPVPEGTSVNFVTESGQIEAIRKTAIDASGIARTTANFVSSSPRPSDGRITVVAYALGEESFLDQNGNNVYDAGEPFQDLGDVYLDREFHNFYNRDRDQFFSFQAGWSATCNAWATGPGATLLALSSSIPSKLDSCDQAWGRAYVRRAIQTVLSTSRPRPVWGTSLPTDVGMYVSSGSSCPAPVSLTTFDAAGRGYTQADPPVALKQSYYRVGQHNIYTGQVGALFFLAADDNGEAFNPMPAGTQVTAVGSDGLTASVAGGSPLPSSINPTGVAVNYKFDDFTFSGTITLSFTTPSGLTTAIPQYISRSMASGNRCN